VNSGCELVDTRARRPYECRSQGLCAAYGWKGTMFNARAAGLTAFLFFMAMPAFADPPRNIDALVSRAMQLAGVPGMAVAIVEHGQVTLARGYGVRRLGSADSVDADTLFEIGSVSKAFTAAALAG